MARPIKRNEIRKFDNYAEIIMNNSKSRAIIDLEDVDKIKDISWYITEFGYVRDTKKTCFLHNIIMGCKGIDHISRNKLDNRQFNLRICSQGDNAFNRSNMSNNTSGYKGINNRYGKYQSQISFKGKRITLGCFETFEEAVKVRKEAEIKYYGVS